MPFELVAAVCTDAVPFGAVTVKTTLAPEAGEPPFVTVALMGTVPGVVKLVPATETVAASDGGVTTVAFAVSLAVVFALEAVIFTAYVPAGALEGAPLPSVTEVDCPGLSVTEDDEKLVDHPEGSVEPKLMVLEEHPEESLLVTETA